MAVRGRRDISFTNWLGLQTFGSAANLPPGWWTDSSNVIVTNDGSAAVLRSPLTVSDTGALPLNVISSFDSTLPVVNIFNYQKQTGPLILFDINGATYSTDLTTTNAIVSTGDTGRVKYLTIDDRAYRLQGSHSNFDTTNGTDIFAVGVTPPTVDPVISYVAGGSGTYAVGLNVSYAYQNTTTGHVSRPGAASNTLGATAGNHTLRIAVTASVELGVDKILVFLTVDGGSIRYLLIDSAGDPVQSPNTTGNIDIDISTIILDTQTPEPSFNFLPPTDDFANFMFKYGNRLCILDFRAAATRSKMQYSANEVVYIGVGWESWPPQNAIYAPNKGDSLRSGIETPIGALLLGEQDSYLIRGFLTDKVSTPTNPVAITESIQSMGWAIGTRSPFSLVTTPFGAMWLDQNKAIRLWPYDGFPGEASLPIRNTLDDIGDTDAIRNAIDATWYQHGKDGGVYVLTATVDGAKKQFCIGVYRDPESNELKFACSTLTTGAYSFAVCEIAGRRRLLQGATGSIQEIFDLDVEGTGWTNADERFFTTVLGNDSNFTYWHSVRFDATSTDGLTLTISNLDGTESKEIPIIDPAETGAGGPFYGLIDDYGYRKILTFTFAKADTDKRVIQNLQVTTVPKGRTI